MKPCPFCGEHIQPAAVKCRFCGEWLDPSKRPSWSGQDLAALTEQIASEVARQLTPNAESSDALPTSLPTSPPARPPRRRSSTRDIPSEPVSVGVIAPDNAGRAAGSVDFDPQSHVQPSVAPAYESPGPYPGLSQGHGEPGRSLGQPAPRGGRWRPPGREESGPKAAVAGPSWRPPLTEEAAPPTDAEAPAPTTSDAVWQAPAWLRPEQSAAELEPSNATQAPVQGQGQGQGQAQSQAQASWAPPTHEQTQSAAPTWDASRPAPSWSPPPAEPIIEAPVWDPMQAQGPAPAGAPARPRGPRIPELSLEPELAGTPQADFAPAPSSSRNAADEHYVDGGFADEFGADELDDEFDDEPALARTEPEPTPKGRPKPKPGKHPKAADAPADAEAPAAPEALGDDDFGDDDDDDFGDFDDEDDEFDDDVSMSSGDLGASLSSMTAPAPARKLPWIPIAGVAGALVLLSAFVFRDAIFGGAGDETSEADEAGEIAQSDPEPEPTPPEPESETGAEALPEPPPPPAIDPAKLETMLSDATSLVNRQKHDDARVIIDEILEKIPQEPHALALLALVQLEKGEFDDALTTATDCVGADANQADCWITIAIIEQENKKLPRALEGYRKYLEIEPDGRYAKSAKSQAQRLSAKVEG